MKRQIIKIAAACAMFAAVCCTETDGIDGNVPSPVDGVPVAVSLRFSPAAESAPGGGIDIPLTRAPFTVAEDEVDNVWVFQFGGTGDDALLVCPPFYIDAQAIAEAGGTGHPVEIPLIDSEGAEHRVVLVANINNRFYPWGLQPGADTPADLKSRYLTLTGEATSYGDGNQNLVMSGSATTVVEPGVTVDGDADAATNNGPGVALVRSLAKVELDLSVDPAAAAGYEVVSVQLRSVSSRLDIFGGMLDRPAGGTYPDMANLKTIDYPAEEDYADGLVTDAVPVKFAWYVPHNERGVAPASVSSKTKTAYAPDGATFFEILARDPEGRGVRYRVYPGANNTSDYNLIPNHRYRSALNITGDGGEVLTDSRIEQFGDVTFPGDNNSFILNPPPAGGAPRRFHIPVTQVNRYWEQTYHGYGGLGRGPLQSATGWTARLLWQDNAGMVRAAGADPEQYVILEKATGTGGDDWFTVTVPAGAVRGNFSVALRIDGQTGVWWSWHLWVTDYNPDVSVASPTGHRFAYPVPGGQLERYGGTVWGYGGSTNNDWSGYDYAVTSPTPAAPYARSFMMDRALGTPSADYVANARSYPVVLYYQYGRKDPFPASNTTLYNIDGTAISGSRADFPEQFWNSSNANARSKPDGIAVADAVLNPMVFYGSSQYSDWSGLNQTTYVWNDPTLLYANATQTDADNGTGRFGKSVYDPCPPGWHVPLYNAWTDFGSNTLMTGRGLGWSDAGFGVRYWPYIQVGERYPVDGKIFLPVTGQRGYNNGTFIDDKTVHYWTCGPSINPSNNDTAYSQSVGSNNSSSVTAAPRARGSAVRCISEGRQ